MTVSSPTHKVYWQEYVEAIATEAAFFTGQKIELGVPQRQKIKTYRSLLSHSFPATFNPDFETSKPDWRERGINLLEASLLGSEKPCKLDLIETKMRRQSAMNLMAYHTHLRSGIPDHQSISYITTFIYDMITQVHSIDKKRFDQVNRAIACKFFAIVAVPVIMGGTWAQKHFTQARYLTLVGKIILTFSAFCLLVNWAYQVRDQARFKTDYEKIGKLADKILFSFSYYDENMKLLLSPSKPYASLYPQFVDQRPSIPSQIPPNLTYWSASTRQGGFTNPFLPKAGNTASRSNQ
jgi:hypothetical protein